MGRPDQHPDPGEVTDILARARQGDTSALDDVFPLVYQTLKRISRRQLRTRGGDSILDTTDLVHEAYLKLTSRAPVDWRDRTHFYSVAARAMRQVLVDHARKRGARKRGGDRRRVPLREETIGRVEDVDDLLALDEAMRRLETRSHRLAKVVELRFFGGMTMAEVARTLGVSTRTVERDWTKARLFLHRELFPDFSPPNRNPPLPPRER